MTHNDQCERIVEIIEMLVADEGAELSIACPNPDFDGPQRIVDVCDQWTDWDTARFEGDTLQDALEAALTSRQAGENREKLKRMYGLSFGLQEQHQMAVYQKAAATASNYIADDDTFPTTIWLACGRKVKIECASPMLEGPQPYLTIETELHPSFEEKQ